VRRAPPLGQVQAEKGDSPGDRRRAGRLAALDVGARAEDRVGIDDCRALHPGEVLALQGNVADLVGRAGRHPLDPPRPEVALGRALQVGLRRAEALGCMMAGVDPVDQLAGRDHRPRRLDPLVGIEVEA
jgi:hypothetical protein